MKNLIAQVEKLNLLLPPYTLVLFSSIFALTLIQEYLTHQDQSHVISSLIHKADVSSMLTLGNSIDDLDLSLTRINRSTDSDLNTRDIGQHSRDDDLDEIKPTSNSSTNNLDSVRNGVVSNESQFGSTSTNIAFFGNNGTSSSNFSNNTTSSNSLASTNSRNNTGSQQNTSVSNSTPTPVQSSSLDQQETILASNQTNTRAQELYEQRRQNVCNTVIARVGINPTASDFNSTGEYYRLRNGYRCFN